MTCVGLLKPSFGRFHSKNYTAHGRERDAEMGKVHSLYLLLAQFTRIQPDLDTDLFRPTPFVFGLGFFLKEL